MRPSRDQVLRHLGRLQGASELQLGSSGGPPQPVTEHGRGARPWLPLQDSSRGKFLLWISP